MHEMAKSGQKRWLLKCDSDTYVHVPRLLELLTDIEASGLSHATPYYFGSIGYGRRRELDQIGLHNATFVMGGPCVALSSGALDRLMPVLETCMTAYTANKHSDTQLGRCFMDLNISAGLIP